MKRALKITSLMCVFLALGAIVAGIFAFRATNRSFFVGYAMFGLITSGGIMGFIGNLAIIGFTVVCYGLAGLNTFADRKREALIWSAVTSLLAVLSIITAIAGHRMTFGDIVAAAVPVIQTLLIIKSAD